MTTTQIAGFTPANIAEVEAATKALRVTYRPEDALGHYSLGRESGIMAAGLASLAPIWAWRWASSKVALVKRVIFTAGNNGTAFAAGTAYFGLHIARSFTASDSGGTAITPAAGMNKLRTSYADSLLTDCRIATTGTLTAGTRFVELDPVGSINAGITATAGASITGPRPLPIFEVPSGDYPLVLAQYEGLVIQAIVPATGTWKFAVKIDWSEVDSYP